MMGGGRKKIFFQRACLWTLVFVLGSVLWGAWTRISLSGDGCGDSWPLCQGGILPQGGKAFVEWIHRLSSGLALLMVLGLFFLSLKVYARGHVVRKLALASLILIVIEALIGAALVLGRLVALDMSAARVIVLAFHMINSLLLAGALTLALRAARAKPLKIKLKIKKPLFYFAAAFPVLALTGNIASLAGTLFPAGSLSEALSLDLLPSPHISIQIRPLHPLLALAFAGSLLWAAARSRACRLPAAGAALAAGSGLAALLSLSPAYLKITHLLLAYLLWTGLVFLSFEPRPLSRSQKNAV